MIAHRVRPLARARRRLPRWRSRPARTSDPIARGVYSDGSASGSPPVVPSSSDGFSARHCRILLSPRAARPPSRVTSRRVVSGSYVSVSGPKKSREADASRLLAAGKLGSLDLWILWEQVAAVEGVNRTVLERATLGRE